jgi:hypothetical protein
MATARSIRVTVNGVTHEALVEPRLTLVDFLRQELALTGTHVGCEHGVCGACTILVNGQSMRSCLMLAVQADGSEITTVEALATDGELHPIQQAFMEEHGLQCGFCTLPDVGPRAPARESEPLRRGDQGRPGRADLPLHRLPEHPAGGARGGGEAPGDPIRQHDPAGLAGDGGGKARGNAKKMSVRIAP